MRRQIMQLRKRRRIIKTEPCSNLQLDCDDVLVAFNNEPLHVFLFFFFRTIDYNILLCASPTTHHND